MLPRAEILALAVAAGCTEDEALVVYDAMVERAMDDLVVDESEVRDWASDYARKQSKEL